MAVPLRASFISSRQTFLFQFLSRITHPPMSKTTRPFRILALPLVRIPHGPLRTTPRAAAAAAADALSPSEPGRTSVTAETAAGIAKKALSPGAVEPMASESPLMLYHVQQPDVPSASGKPPIYQRALDKAADEWNKLGHKPRNSWMFWFHERGEKLMDRINYEEWALKAVHEGRGVKVANAKKGEKQEMIEVGVRARVARKRVDVWADQRSRCCGRRCRASACPSCSPSCIAASYTPSRTTVRA